MDRAGDIGTAEFWLHVPSALAAADEILAWAHVDRTLQLAPSRAGMRAVRQMADALPTPLRRTPYPDLAMLRCLPPFDALSPANSFLVLLRIEAEQLADLFLSPTDAGRLALAVDRLRVLFGTYTAAASVVLYMSDLDPDDTTPPKGAA
jgi:hypothetical protein